MTPHPPPASLQALETRAERFDFFAAVRLVEAAFPDRARFGEGRRAIDEPIRLGQPPHLIFPPADIAGFEPAGAGPTPRLRSYVLGLFGPHGPLRRRAIMSVYRAAATLLGKAPIRRLRVGTADEPKTYVRQLTGWARAARWTSLRGVDYTHAAQTVDVPCLPFSGAGDWMCTPSDARAFSGHLKCAADVRIVGRAHGDAIDPDHFQLFTRSELRPLWRDARGLAIGIGVVVLASAALLYRIVGTPAALQPQVAQAPKTLDEAIAQLQAELQRDPRQPDGWRLLGQALQREGKAVESRDAFADGGAPLSTAQPSSSSRSASSS